MRRCRVLLLFIIVGVASFGQDITVDQYIDTYKDLAVSEMKGFGIPASITLAQGILESASGNSDLAVKAKNHFGIKCHKDWSGKSYTMDDDARNECFRKYQTVEDSYRDHSEFLSRDRYASLFDLKITDYSGWAYGLKKAGYATNPRYPELLIRIIDENQLYRFDNGRIASRKIENFGSGERKTALFIDPEEAVAYSVFANNIPVDSLDSGRLLFENNMVRYTYAIEGDDPYSLAHEFNIYAWQIMKYNEIEKEDVFSGGQVIYLEKKRRKSDRQYTQHTVETGESLVFLSQLYAVRLKRLYRMNGMKKDADVFPGQTVRLR